MNILTYFFFIWLEMVKLQELKPQWRPKLATSYYKKERRQTTTQGIKFLRTSVISMQGKNNHRGIPCCL